MSKNTKTTEADSTEENQQGTSTEGDGENSQTQEFSRPQVPLIKLHAHFSTFISLRSAIDKYQRENQVQLIVKDSKLLSSESTKKIIPKVYHLVNQKLMYHSITYCCKCHGELKQKPGSRVKNIGAKRLSCPMYMRFKLSCDLQSLVLFDISEAHNHFTDPNTFQMSPRQQVYRLSAIKRGKPDPGTDSTNTRQVSTKTKITSNKDVQTLIATAIKDVNSISSLEGAEYRPPAKSARISEQVESNKPSITGQAKRIPTVTDVSSDSDNSDDDDGELYQDNPDTPLDLDSSSCSDSEDEAFRTNLSFLPLPIRLIGSAIRSHPELISSSKQLIESQQDLLIAQKKYLVLKNKALELKNAKLAIELKNLEKSQDSTVPDQATTVYLQRQ